MAAYLSTGHAKGRGTASGPMGEAVDHSLSKLAPEDIKAINAVLEIWADLGGKQPRPVVPAQ